MTYTPTKLDEALELEIQAAGLCMQHYIESTKDQHMAECSRMRMERLLSNRSPEYVRYLEEKRGLV